MKKVNFAYHTGDYATTPPELVGMVALGGAGVLEAPYRHYFEVRRFKGLVDPLTKDMNVLELGSGNGRWVEALAPLVGHYTAVDLTPEAVAIARETAERKGIRNVTFHEMSITDFRGDRPYDLIYFSGVSQFLDDEALGRVFDELAPWIKPKTIIVDRSTLNFPERLVTETGEYFSIYRTPAELDALLWSRGFFAASRRPSYRILRINPLLHRLRNHPRILRYAERWAKTGGFVPMHLMLALTLIADLVQPIDVAKRGWSHDFSIYRRGR